MYTYDLKKVLHPTNWKNSFTKFGIYAAIFIVAIIISLLPLVAKKSAPSQQQKRYPTDLKYVYFWSPTISNRFIQKKSFFTHNRNEFPTGQTAFIDQKCPNINCYITYDKKFLNNDESNFDAIVINAHEVNKFSINELNFTRSPNQNYIFRSQEAADKHPVCNHRFDNFFNLTWTYKLNSDIAQPFIKIYDTNNTLVGPKENVDWITEMKHTDIRNKISTKNKAVAWIVNKCKSKAKHQEFLSELKNELKGYNYTVDVFGPCGDHKCPGRNLISCFRMIEKRYFFHLVLEDYISEDYVHENIVKTLMYNIIPITFGGADYTRFLPPGSYVNIQTFDLKKLGALLDYLIKNPNKYEYFFDWKNHYFYTVTPRNYICDLCNILNGNNTAKVYKYFRYWWNSDYKDMCDKIRLYTLFNSERELTAL